MLIYVYVLQDTECRRACFCRLPACGACEGWAADDPTGPGLSRRYHHPPTGDQVLGSEGSYLGSRYTATQLGGFQERYGKNWDIVQRTVGVLVGVADISRLMVRTTAHRTVVGVHFAMAGTMPEPATSQSVHR